VNKDYTETFGSSKNCLEGNTFAWFHSWLLESLFFSNTSREDQSFVWSIWICFIVIVLFPNL